MDPVMINISVGIIATGYAVAGLFFLRFWRNTRDRLFALFALAFFVLATNRVAVSLLTHGGEDDGHFYWIRLAAFALILVAIVDKNRPRRFFAVKKVGITDQATGPASRPGPASRGP